MMIYLPRTDLSSGIEEPRVGSSSSLMGKAF